MRSRALLLLAVFVASIVVSVLLWVLVDPGVQLVGVDELVERRSDAVAYFTLDYLFVVVYGVLAPLIAWRFGSVRWSVDGRPPVWLIAGIVLLSAGAAFDATENTLLLLASADADASKVDLAHALALPKYALGVAGGLVCLRAVAAAVGVVRGRSG